jgi:hypothetical protein
LASVIVGTAAARSMGIIRRCSGGLVLHEFLGLGKNRRVICTSSIGILGLLAPAYRRARIVPKSPLRPSHSLSNLPSAHSGPSPRLISHPTGPLAQRAPPTRAPTRPPNGHIQRTSQRP